MSLDMQEFKTDTIMKELFDDYKEFTKKDWLLYGIIAPLVLVLIAVLSSYGD